MTEPALIPTMALSGVDVGISVSDSDDLERLGLTQFHCDIAVAELVRSVILAGGKVTYGGRLKPAGFTQILIDEVQKYSAGREALTICVSQSEYVRMTHEELQTLDQSFGTFARLLVIDEDAVAHSLAQYSAPTEAPDVARSLSAMRVHVARSTQARVVLGGKLQNFAGRMPGVIEELIESMNSNSRVYIAGGFGGASALAVSALGIESQSWAPPAYPQGSEDPALNEPISLLRSAYENHDHDDGLTNAERAQLASTHRAGDIATFIVLGLARSVAGLTPAES